MWCFIQSIFFSLVVHGDGVIITIIITHSPRRSFVEKHDKRTTTTKHDNWKEKRQVHNENCKQNSHVFLNGQPTTTKNDFSSFRDSSFFYRKNSIQLFLSIIICKTINGLNSIDDWSYVKKKSNVNKKLMFESLSIQSIYFMLDKKMSFFDFLNFGNLFCFLLFEIIIMMIIFCGKCPWTFFINKWWEKSFGASNNISGNVCVCDNL